MEVFTQKKGLGCWSFRILWNEHYRKQLESGDKDGNAGRRILRYDD